MAVLVSRLVADVESQRPLRSVCLPRPANLGGHAVMVGGVQSQAERGDAVDMAADAFAGEQQRGELRRRAGQLRDAGAGERLAGRPVTARA